MYLELFINLENFKVHFDSCMIYFRILSDQLYMYIISYNKNFKVYKMLMRRKEALCIYQKQFSVKYQRYLRCI